MRIFYKVLSWGLGHATRSLPIMRALLRMGCQLTVSSSGRALQLLKVELGSSCAYADIPDINSSWGRDYHWLFLLPKAPRELPRFFSMTERERVEVARHIARHPCDLIISDNCYGAAIDGTPSIMICHHLKPFWFWRTKLLQDLNEKLGAPLLNRFDRILVPDFPGSILSGGLSKDLRYIDPSKVHFIGILSDCLLQNGNVDQDADDELDYLVIVSGHEPQRTSFERQILEEVRYLNGRTLVVLGCPELGSRRIKLSERIELMTFADKKTREQLISRARMLIARPGYSTFMDLIKLRKSHALFIPTPNQTEQEYLAAYHRDLGNLWSVSQRKLNLKQDVAAAERVRFFPGLEARPTVDTVVNFLRHMSEVLRPAGPQDSQRVYGGVCPSALGANRVPVAPGTP